MTEVWEHALEHAKDKDKVKEQQKWETFLKTKFDQEINTAIRQNVEPNYRYTMTRVLNKMGHEVEPRWSKTVQITYTLSKSYQQTDFTCSTQPTRTEYGTSLAKSRKHNGTTKSKLPPQLMRDTWEKCPHDKVVEQEIRTGYKVNKNKYPHPEDLVSEAFKLIGWKVPSTQYRTFNMHSPRDLLQEDTK